MHKGEKFYNIRILGQFSNIKNDIWRFAFHFQLL